MNKKYRTEGEMILLVYDRTQFNTLFIYPIILKSINCTQILVIDSERAMLLHPKAQFSMCPMDC